MRVILYFLFLLIFTGCSSKNEEVLDTIEVDSILLKSQSSLDTAKYISNKSDSVTKESIVKVVKEIKFLTNEVEKYKEINLLTSQKVATEKIIYRVDTIYIETKKNFWGKEKTSTSIKSDSVVNEKIDTVTKNVIDTTLINN
jgi:hypothetical protein